MSKIIIGIYDKKAKAFLSLVICENEEVAKRHFNVLCNGDTLIAAAPADFELHKFGSWNQETGDIVLAHAVLIEGSSLCIVKE